MNITLSTGWRHRVPTLIDGVDFSSPKPFLREFILMKSRLGGFRQVPKLAQAEKLESEKSMKFFAECFGVGVNFSAFSLFQLFGFFKLRDLSEPPQTRIR